MGVNRREVLDHRAFYGDRDHHHIGLVSVAYWHFGRDRVQIDCDIAMPELHTSAFGVVYSPSEAQAEIADQRVKIADRCDDLVSRLKAMSTFLRAAPDPSWISRLDVAVLSLERTHRIDQLKSRLESARVSTQ